MGDAVMEPTEDERVLAALAHASIVANAVNLAGMIATSLIWTMQRERSPYVRAHALQALVYQGVVLLVMIVLVLFWGVCLALSLLPVALRPDLYRNSLPNYAFWLGLLGLLTPIGFGIVATLYGLFGAYQSYHGRPFRYPVIGRLVRRDFTPVASAPSAAHASAEVSSAASVEPPVAAPDPPIVTPPPQEEPTAVEATPQPPPEASAPPTPKRRARRPSPDEDA
jgi:uncharacterized Tic20 family protein